MKRSTKATLLSALVFPGAGQFYLRRYLPAVVLLVTATVALYYLLVPVVAIATNLADKLVSGELQPDAELMVEVLGATGQAVPLHAMNNATLVLLVTWLAGVIHAWVVGRKQDAMQSPVA